MKHLFENVNGLLFVGFLRERWFLEAPWLVKENHTSCVFKRYWINRFAVQSFSDQNSVQGSPTILIITLFHE